MANDEEEQSAAYLAGWNYTDGPPPNVHYRPSIPPIKQSLNLEDLIDLETGEYK